MPALAQALATVAPGKAPACPPCLTDLVYGLVWFPLLLTDTHFGVLCYVVLPWGPDPCLLKVLTGAVEMCAASAVPGLPSPALGSAPGLAVLAWQSSGEREVHPYVPEIRCEETTALVLLLSPGVNFPL